MLYRFLAMVIAFVCSVAEAKVVKVEIDRREDVLSGRSLGQFGAYEKIVGTVYFSVDGFAPENNAVVDLRAAETDEAGRVSFSADFYVLRPKDRSNGSLILEIPNRGGKALLRMLQGATPSLDPTEAAHFGDRFLLDRGFTVAWLGWQFDVRNEAGLLGLRAPRVPGVTGLVRSDFIVPDKRTVQPLGHVIAGRIGGTEYPVADPSHPRTELTVRDAPLSDRTLIDRERWDWVRNDEEITALSFPDGFEPGRIYELIYEARDPVVVGTGLLAVRDFADYVKNAQGALLKADHVIAFGHSQSGRFLRHFLFQGFNRSETGGRALDGVYANAAGAGRGSFNHRFAQPSRDAQPMEALFYPTDLFPFTDLPTRNPFTRATNGLQSGELAPMVVYGNTSYEYWGRAGSLIHTTPDGRSDAPLPDHVRIYHFAGLQHFQRGFPPEKMEVPHIRGRSVMNPNPVRWSLRATLVGLHRWVTGSGSPPPSVYPRIDNGTLIPVARALASFPKIPGVTPPKDAHLAYNVAYGTQWQKGIITEHPPKVGRAYTTLVPAVDADGNDLAGIRIPQLEVPLATYTPWNLRDPSIGAEDQRVSFLGSFFPFAASANPADPRPSIAERYSSQAAYLGAYAIAALELVRQGYLLPEDLPSVLERGVAEWNHIAGQRAAGE
ncbi:MAG: alpha/beta hydrolase domain-containing protein [Myxococcota bacterium]